MPRVTIFQCLRLSIPCQRVWLAATLLAVGFLSVGAVLWEHDCPASEDVDFFEKRIRPVLVAHCYECHSASADEIQGGLRLDSRDAARLGGDSGPAVVPGKPNESLILEALRHDGLAMPPGKKLPLQVIENFQRWIERGAVDPRAEASRAGLQDEIRQAARSHWAFQPITRPAPPNVVGNRRVQSPIDLFIQARLEAAGLQLSTPAGKATLARRASFDLLGLPPTPEQLQAFRADSSPDAFARFVDSLLASPHYGERWGRHWLDVARYADNKGYVFFEEQRYPWAWTYRDYVTQAFNEDRPFDRFVLEQLAADRLDLGGDARPLRAMGFLTVGARFMNNAHDVIDDRIDVVTRGLMGMTLSCARCHDHKYDPLTQADYYALYGVFRSSAEPILPPEYRPGGDTQAERKFREGMRERLDKLHAFIAEQRRQIIEGARRRVAEYLLAVHGKRDHPDTEDFMLLTDKGALNPAMIHRWEVYLERARREEDPIWSIWHAYGELSDEQFAEAAPQLHARLVLDPPPSAVHPLVREAFAGGPPGGMEDVAERYAQLLHRIEGEWTALREAAADGRAEPRRLPDDAAESLRQVFFGPQSPPMIPRELSWGFLDLLPDRPTQNEFKKLLKEVETWSGNEPGAPPRAMVLQDVESPYEPVVFLRGNPNRRGPRVSRRFPEFLAPPDAEPFGAGSGRLQLARRIVAPDNPLTARVLANRVWMHHFRTGLVTTPSDFGLRSDLPSHPELLDWLAAELQSSGWSIKHLHRTIMNSAVYQQASRRPESEESAALRIDPENRLLWAYPRRRLNFEALRDALLAVSGSLDPVLGGPPRQLLEGFDRRRTIYGFVDRMNLPGLMRAFDFPDPAASSPGRERTTVAPQALFFLNHAFVSECAGRLLERPDVAACESPEEKIEQIYRILFCRAPLEHEKQLARSFLAAQDGVPRLGASWSYGYGAVDETLGRVTGFTRLTHWTGERWQAGPQLPDPKLGWVFLDRLGGHPAATPERCAIRRWTAPEAGEYALRGTLTHRPEPGNGVRGRLVSSRDGLLGTWTAHHAEVETSVESIRLEAGDTLDLVVDFQGDILHDEHEWPVVMRNQASVRKEEPAARIADSRAEFRGPPPDPWRDYVHALLMTNEFVFVD